MNNVTLLDQREVEKYRQLWYAGAIPEFDTHFRLLLHHHVFCQLRRSN